ncbi:MAG: methyl-accepting chemotaxis protein [Spirochaetota bacterium]|nr:methyl-accepting chemotaxis protein [Spirochaetota bacterium]
MNHGTYEIAIVFFIISLFTSIFIFKVRKKSNLLPISLVVLMFSICFAVMTFVDSFVIQYFTESHYADNEYYKVDKGFGYYLTYLLSGFFLFISLTFITYYFYIIPKHYKDSKIYKYLKENLKDSLAENISKQNISIEILSEERDHFKNNYDKLIKSLNLNIKTVYDVQVQLDKVTNLMKRIMNPDNQNSEVKQINLVSKALEAMFILDKSIEKTIDEMKNQSETLKLTFDAFDITTLSMEKVDAFTKEAKLLASNLSSTAQKGQEAVELTVLAIEEIAKSSMLMQQFVVTIKNISEKTNLLAMNAAIEAAHAGEKGKGFAVVASEVRKLSNNTNVATAEIKKNINLILEKIRNAVELVNNSKLTFENILEDIKSTNNINQEIYKISQENVRQGREIITAINQLRSITQRIIEASADELFQTNEVLVAMNEINSVVGVIIQAVKESDNSIKDNIVRIEEDFSHLRSINPPSGNGNLISSKTKSSNEP